MAESLPWGELLASGGVNAALSFVIYKLWYEIKEIRAEHAQVLKEQADFWRQVALDAKKGDDNA